MCCDDLFHAPVFPKLVAVPEFDVSKVILIIKIECGRIDAFIFQEVIPPVADASVTIAHNYKTGEIITGDDGGGLE